MEYQKIDQNRLRAQVEVAVKTGNFRNAELGQYVSDICKKVLSQKCYVGYTEDWKMEMFGEACLAVYKAMETAKTEKDSLFNYLYTSAHNSCKKTLQKLQNVHIQLDETNKATLDPFYIRNKARLARGLIKKNEDKILEAAQTKKMPLLKNVVGRAARVFAESLKKNQLTDLLKIAKKNREAIC